MFLDREDALEEAEWLGASKVPPAEARKRVKGCNRCARVIFGMDNTVDLDFTNHVVLIIDYLEGISGKRVYDPQQRSFTHYTKKEKK